MGFGKIIGFTVVGIGILGAVGFMVVKSPIGQKFTGQGNSMEPMGTPVRIEQVTLGDLQRTVSAPGSIEPRTLVKISSQVSAKVLALPFREGDLVHEGDVVVRLDPQNLTAALDSAKAGLKQQEASLLGSEASLINARLQYDRLQSLQETGDATQAELDGAEAQYLNAQSNKAVIEASIEQARARIEQAEKDLENTNITSSITGLVISLSTEVGETVIVGTTNNPGSVIMEIADLSEMLLKAAVDEANIAPVEIGQDTTIYINAYTDRTYTGTVSNIARKRQVAGDGTGTFEVEIPIDLAEGETLYTGLTASTDIAVEHFYDTILVPSQAVLDRRIEDLPEDVVEGNEQIDSNKTFARVVYKIVDGKAIATPVIVGASDLTSTVILEGLEEDDQIIVGPYRVLVTLRHDMNVRDMNAETEEAETDAENADIDSESDDTDDSDDNESSDTSDSDTQEVAEGEDDS
jgi:HlyD family secretion protein